VQLVLSGAVDQGNSGGPVLKDGAVVGMVTQAQRQSGRALPAQLLQRVLERSWGVAVATGPPAAAPRPAAVPPPAARTEPPAASPREAPAARPEKAAWSPGQTFKDCDDFCPEMVVLPAGTFQMGSPDNEKGRIAQEGPVDSVTIPAAFVGKFEITRSQFARFARETGRNMSGGCQVWDDKEGKGKLDSARSWLDPGFAQSDDHPVVCVSFEDATAYVDWLAKQTGKPYRLLSDAEWRYAARAGTTTRRYWGGTQADWRDSEQQACEYANVGDRRGKAKHPSWTWQTFDCDDGYAETAPVGRYKPNAFGLHDMLGNAWEWQQGCFNWGSGKCEESLIHGGSWDSRPGDVRSDDLTSATTSMGWYNLGFRVARTLP